MEVRCERCRAQYVFSDDQVGEQGLTVRCSNCGHLFKVKKKALVVTLPVNDEAGAAGAVSAADAQRAAAVQAAAQAVKTETERSGWALRQPSGQTYAFRDMTTLHRWIVERKAHREDEIARGNEPWRRLGTISELQSFFAVVEAAERAARTPSPPQPTAVQFPAVTFPGPGAPPPPAKTDQAFPPPPPSPRTEIAFPAQKAPASPKTEVAFPAQKAPAPPKTEVAFPAQKAPAPPKTEVAFPAQRAPSSPRTAIDFPAQQAPAAPVAAETGLPPPPAPVESPLAGLFTPEPMLPPRDDPFANAAPAGDTRPDLGYPATVEGLPPPPAPAAAPLRATAAWEGEAPVVSSKRAAPEPAWTSADQQTGGTFIDGRSLRAPKGGRGIGSALAVAAIVVAVVGGAGWWFLLRETPPPPPVAAAPAPSAPVPAPAAPAPAPQQKPAEAAPAPAPAAPEPAAEPKAVEAAPAPGAEQKPAEAAPAAPVPSEAAPAARPAEKAPEPKPAAAGGAAPPPGKAPARSPEPAGAKALVAQAKRALDKGNAKQALDLYGKAVALEPKNVAALAGRGWSYLELSQYAPAEASFQSALDANAEDPSALLGLAETYRYEGRRADAVQYYERYLAVSPDGEDAVAAQNAIKSLKE